MQAVFRLIECGGAWRFDYLIGHLHPALCRQAMHEYSLFARVGKKCLIHLVRREKSEIIRFSSLMFLLKVPKRSIRQQKMKNLLLMALRLLILALLVGAFARPYMTQPAKPVANANSNRGTVLMRRLR